MSKQVINLGSGPNAHNGEGARTAGQKINDNFTELYGVFEVTIDVPYTSFKLVHKGFGNDEIYPEIGDIFCGWSNDGAIRYSEAKWLGGAFTDAANFLPIVQTEI